MSSHKTIDPKLLAQASTWFCRMSDPGDDPQDPFKTHAERQSAFAAWLRASPQHVRAYFLVADGFRKLRTQAPAARRQADTPHGVACAGFSARSAIKRGLRLTAWFSLGRQVFTLALSVQGAHVRHKICAGLLGVIWTIRVAFLVPDPVHAPCSQPYSTASGQQSTITLVDGTSVTLNTATSIYVCVSAHERVVQLASGEAFFNVHHDSTRPFQVVSGRTSIEDLGTAFDVYRRPRDTQVAVIEGQVSVFGEPVVRPSDRVGRVSRPVVVSAGQQVDMPHAASGVVSVTTLNAEQRMRLVAWRQNQIVLTGLSLAEAAYEISRYNAVKFVIRDPAVAALRPGGQVYATHVERFLDIIQRQLDVVSTPQGTRSGVRVIALTSNHSKGSTMRKDLH
jgi:ferric-dicitrate binding protein FerR (iron transport regulator)